MTESFVKEVIKAVIVESAKSDPWLNNFNEEKFATSIINLTKSI